MFICSECAEKKLTEEGKDFPFLGSYGRCEICRKGPRNCKDVPSGSRWMWKDN